MKFKACTMKDIPAMGNMDSPFAKLVMDFIDSGAEAAEIEHEPYGLSSASSSIRNICYRGKVPVRVMQRHKRLYLIRTDLEQINKGGNK